MWFLISKMDRPLVLSIDASLPWNGSTYTPWSASERVLRVDRDGELPCWTKGPRLRSRGRDPRPFLTATKPKSLRFLSGSNRHHVPSAMAPRARKSLAREAQSDTDTVREPPKTNEVRFVFVMWMLRDAAHSPPTEHLCELAAVLLVFSVFC
jgi:hypothetical protein